MGGRWHSPLALAAALAAAAVLAGGVASYFNTRAVAESTEWVAHSLEVRAELGEVLSLLKDVETGKRGYLLTGRGEHLKPYHEAAARLPARIDRLESMTADRPAQVAHVRELRRLALEKLAFVDAILQLRASGDPSGAVEAVKTGHGKRLMDGARAVVTAMRAEEDRWLVERGRNVQAAAHRTTTFLAMSTGLVLVLVLSVYLTGRRAAEQVREEARQLAAEMEQRVEERTRALTAANADLDALSYTLAHDLRAPVRNMHALAEALAKDYEEQLPGEAREYTRRIVAAAVRMDSLIRDLVGYARLSREALRPHPIDLNEVLSAVLTQMRPELEERRAEVNVDRPLGRVMAHRTTLEQVITNLLGNAAKFVEPGGAAKIHVRSEQRGGRVRLWVEDNGLGVAPEDAERIFQVFERLHGQEAYPGTGVGLAIVRKGTERMGGSCGVEPGPGGGSQFWIDLPKQEAA